MHIGNYYQLMAEYNRWMNGKLYAVCAEIPDDKRKSDLGAFFKSIHGTLNHLLWGDRIWLWRFTDHPFPVTPIGEEMYTDFDELRAERERMDAFILNWASTLDEDWLRKPFEFKSRLDSKTDALPLGCSLHSCSTIRPTTAARSQRSSNNSGVSPGSPISLGCRAP
jgi:uncharacterized damage-inducible protein DinB